MRKAQSSMEFMIAISIIIIIFFIILGVSLNKGIELNKLNKELKEKNECLRLSNLITYGLITGNNYTTIIDFNMSIDPDNKIIRIDDKTTCTISTGAVNKVNLIKNKKIIIEKN